MVLTCNVVLSYKTCPYSTETESKSQEIDGDDEDLGLDEEHAEFSTSESE